jgi:hypothetical protein
VAALCLYLATGSSVPDSHDTTANAQVPVSLFDDGDIAVSPREAPLLFLWRLDSQVPRSGGPDGEPLFVGAFGPATSLPALPAPR